MSVNPYAAVIDATKAILKADIDAANSLAAKVASAGNEEALVAEVRKTSDDAQVVKFREQYEKAMAMLLAQEQKIDAYIRESGLVSTEPVDVEKVSAEYKEVATRIKAAKGMIKALPGVEDEVFADLPALSTLPGQRGPREGSGAGILRPRISGIKMNGEDIFANVATKDKDSEGNPVKVRKSNFSILAAHLAKVADVKVEVSDLQAAAFAAAKTTDLSELNGKPFTFVFNCGKEGAEKNYEIEVTPATKG